MEHVHATHHGRLIHEWKLVNCPGDTSDLSINLDEDLVNNGP